MTGEQGLDRFRLRRLLGEAGLLLLTAVLIAGAAWAVRTPRLPLAADATAYSMNIEFPLVGPAAAMAIHSADTHYFVDTRPVADGGHVPGSFPVRQDEFDDDVMALRDFLLPEDPLVLYGDGDLLALAAVAARLKDRGFTDLTLMEGSFSAWRSAGGSVSGDAGLESGEGSDE